MAAEVVHQPQVPSDVCLLSADGVRLRVHKQVLACACGTFERALDAELSGGELPVAETAQQLQASGLCWEAAVVAATAACAERGLATVWDLFSAQPSMHAILHGHLPCLQEGLLDHIYQRRSRRRRHLTKGGVRLSLELARKYDCPALLDKCEDFLCANAFQLSASPR